MTLTSVALRNLTRHRLRTLITLGAIAFGGTVVIFTGGYFQDTFTKMRESYIQAHTRHLQLFRKGFDVNGKKDPFHYLIDNPLSLVTELKKDSRIIAVAPRLKFATLLSSGDQITACQVEAGDLDAQTSEQTASAPLHLMMKNGLIMDEGAPLDENYPFGILMGQAMAQRLKIHTGSPITLMASTVGGSVNAFDGMVQGVFLTSAKVYDDNVIRMSMRGAQQLLRTSAAQALVVTLARTEDTAAVRTELENTIARDHLDLEIKSWEELNDFYFKTRMLFLKVFLVLKIVITLLVVLCIYNTMTLNVLERTSEIATMRALGRTSRDIVALFFLEGAWLGIVGGAAGVALGALATWAAGRIGLPMPPPPGGTLAWVSTPVVMGQHLLTAFALCVVASLISSVLPALHASRLDVAEGLRAVN